jgi:DNA topoisomerase VI subunit B
MQIFQSEKTMKQPTLDRTTFRTSREMDFFSEKELTTQTGHSINEWPLVILKELIDNSLDACEETDTPPIIDVTADACGIIIRDNGPGLPEKTLKAAMDFTVRASNREAYVAPDRGQQGNALKTILPMPVVIDPEHGKLVITTHGKRHVITCGADPISQRAIVNDDVSPVGKCKNSRSRRVDKSSFIGGTEVRIEWSPRNDSDGDVLWPFDDLAVLWEGWIPTFSDQFQMIVEGFAVFNPHATITLDWFGKKTTWDATDSKWRKWKPHQPTSPHWYETPHMERLIGAYVTHDRENGSDRLVSDFIAEFDGLTGSQKRAKVLVETDLRRVNLSEFAINQRLDSGRIENLLAIMQRHTRPVKAQRLGIIGEDHLRARLLGMGVQKDSFRYSKKLSKDGLPWVLESAFGWLGDESDDSRRIFAGANWSAAIKNPFRSFGATGEGLEAALNQQRAGRNEPIVFVLHLAHPRVEYTDRGKSAIVIGGAA